MSEQKTAEAPQVELNDILAARKEKLDAMRAKGQAFPNDFRRKDISDKLNAKYNEKTKEELEELAVEVNYRGSYDDSPYYGQSKFCHYSRYGRTYSSLRST